jgi:hypothetical protein
MSMMSELEENRHGSLPIKTNQQGGFTIPDNYFDSMKSSIISNTSNDNLKIDNQQGGFVVPVLFFETQKNQILSKIISNRAKKISLSYNQIILRVSSIAAMITVVGFLFLFENSSKSPDFTASFSNEEILNHLEKNDVSEDLICELLNRNKTDKKDNDIEKYLYENVDEDILTENL